MTEVRGLRLHASIAVKEKRLEALRAGRDVRDPLLVEAVADAQLLGSLQLAGLTFTWDEVKASRRDGAGPAPLVGLRRAQQAVEPRAAFSLAALLAWHRAATGIDAGFRRGDRQPPAGDREAIALGGGAPPPAPAAFVESRLTLFERWLDAESARALSAAALGALVLARLVEILPFDEANGRVARLAASHVIVRAGGRPPILVAGDAARLRDGLQAAFRLETGPLARLLEEASERALDVMIQTLEPPGTGAERG